MLLDEPKLSPEKARLLSPLQLAYIGDAVWDILVRTQLVRRGLNVRHMHAEAIRRVNAGAQARVMERLAPLLTETEKSVAQRGRNAHPHHSVPKNQNPEDYSDATGLESLIGYLYLTGDEERLRTLFAAAQEE
ncbi:MAG: ribonuclease III [Clostridia bacterium]|nr:ribonuclease III [Clostridia bacterium]MBR4459495.1 ribonuclease III [Clostridia bacterium]